MQRFHQLKVSDVRRETEDCVSIAFDIPEVLKEVFTYKQGQNITIKANVKGEELRRSYSICTSPVEGLPLRVAVKKVAGGRFSTYANEGLKIGDELEVMTPTGKFYTEVSPSQAKKYVAFAAGSGITPIISIIKTVLHTEPNSYFTLFYGNKHSGSIIFKEELEDLKNLFLDRFATYHILSREESDIDILSGRIDGDRCKKLCEVMLKPNEVDEYFLCGPEGMIQEVSETLQGLGVDKKKIHFELFAAAGSGTGLGYTTDTSEAATTTEVESTVTVIIDGNRTRFSLSSKDKSILDAAMVQGLDVPFACKGGVCCTCKAKLLKGNVHMDKNFALENDEVENGFILTCQSHPLTDEVEVDFDSI